MKKEQKEKVYITRDKGPYPDEIWVWRKPEKGQYIPYNKSESSDLKNYSRKDENLCRTSNYNPKDFKKKFGLTIRKGEKKQVELPCNLLNDKKYILIKSDFK